MQSHRSCRSLAVIAEIGLAAGCFGETVGRAHLGPFLKLGLFRHHSTLCLILGLQLGSYVVDFLSFETLERYLKAGHPIEPQTESNPKSEHRYPTQQTRILS